MNTFYDELYYYQNALQTLSTGFTRCLYSMHAARPQHTHSALEDPTALPQRPHSALSNTLCKRQAVAFVLSIIKIAWCSGRLHSIFTAFPQRCWRLHSAHLGFLNAVETLNENIVKINSSVTYISISI